MVIRVLLPLICYGFLLAGCSALITPLSRENREWCSLTSTVLMTAQLLWLRSIFVTLRLVLFSGHRHWKPVVVQGLVVHNVSSCLSSGIL